MRSSPPHSPALRPAADLRLAGVVLLLHPLLMAGIALGCGVEWQRVLILGEPLLLALLARWDLRTKRDSSRRFALAIGLLNVGFGIGYGAVLQNGFVALSSAVAGCAMLMLLFGRTGIARARLAAIGVLAGGHLLLAGLLIFAWLGLSSASQAMRSGDYHTASDSLERVAPLLAMRHGPSNERALIQARRIELLLRTNQPLRARELLRTLRVLASDLKLAAAGQRGHIDQQALPWVIRWDALLRLEAMAYAGAAFGETLPPNAQDPLSGALSHPGDGLSWSRILLPTTDPLAR